MKEILDDYADKKERDDKVRRAEESRNKELKEILTDEQYEKYLKLDAERKKERRMETKHKLK